MALSNLQELERTVGRQQEDIVQGGYALYSQKEAVQINRFFCLTKGLPRAL